MGAVRQAVNKSAGKSGSVRRNSSAPHAARTTHLTGLITDSESGAAGAVGAAGDNGAIGKINL